MRDYYHLHFRENNITVILIACQAINLDPRDDYARNVGNLCRTNLSGQWGRSFIWIVSDVRYGAVDRKANNRNAILQSPRSSSLSLILRPKWNIPCVKQIIFDG